MMPHCRYRENLRQNLRRQRGIMHFDARKAKLLTAGQHCTISDCPGLRLEASATRRTWVYRYKSPIDMRMRQVKIGEWPAMSMAAAVAAWETLRSKRDD